jgi:hypothetical protein
MADYGDTGPVSSYEEDHFIPLELGGSPSDPRNLWPEPGASPNPKDKVEDAAHRAVCDGRMSLSDAQAGMAANWIVLGEQLGISASTTPAPPSTTEVTTLPSTVPVTASASGCSPTSSTGHCYKRGEYCPAADRGKKGTDADGNTITCEDVNGTWRWE